MGFDPRVRKIPWRRKWQPTPVFLAGKSHGQRSLAGYSPWQAMCKESDTTEQLDNNKQLVKETPESSLASSCGDTVRSPSVNHEENPHQTPSLFAWSWCLDLGSFQTVRNKCLLISHPFCGVLLQQPRWSKAVSYSYFKVFSTWICTFCVVLFLFFLWIAIIKKIFASVMSSNWLLLTYMKAIDFYIILCFIPLVILLLFQNWLAGSC